MADYSSLQELLRHSQRSKTLFDGLNRKVQVMLQEQRQDIHTFEELQKASRFRK